jgi:hypothetical protein
MRFPLSMTLGMGAYIAKNKLSPPPQWQKSASGDDSANPFKIIMHARAGDEPEFVHPDDQQALPARAHAGAATRLQSYLHRVRPYS